MGTEPSSTRWARFEALQRLQEHVSHAILVMARAPLLDIHVPHRLSVIVHL
jgi:hypothetical protein